MGTQLSEHRAFETFYKDVRGRLLLQTWALTGDLSAAQKAVRDALVIAWHHWRKVRRLDPATSAREDWVRPLAWSRAQRRHSVPHLHRDKSVPAEAKATLAALHKLPLNQRKALLLATLGDLPLDQLAREIGITQPRAERELQAALTTYAATLGVPLEDLMATFEPLAEVVAGQRWPRGSILTRAGSARRRTHTLAGALVAVATLVGSGYFVANQADARPRLEALSLHDEGSSSAATASLDSSYPLSAADLLSGDDVGADLGGRWSTEITSDNKRGTGLVLPCQQGRYADPHAKAALVRTFTGKGKHVTAGQSAEASASATAAKAAYARALQWYAGCVDPRVQLMYTRDVRGIGDEATLVGLRDWDDPVRAVVIGVARTGSITTSVATTLPGTTKAAMPRTTELLGAAVQHACTLPGHGDCTEDEPRTKDVPPIAVGKYPGLLGEVDLPPVRGVAKPWAGTVPVAAKSNLAATRCDNADFHAKGVSGDLTRTFVIPTAKNLAPAFGLTETVGDLGKAKAAASFVADIRHRLATCGDRELGSHVTPLRSESRGERQIDVWRVVVETTKTDTVTYLMAVARQGSAVAQLGFVPSGTVDMDPAAFVALADRAADRLAHL